MFTLSAFADEISPDPQEQIDVLSRCGVRHIELRSIHKTNVLDLTDLQVKEFKSLLDRHGFRLSAIGSPVGKIKIDQPFEPHLKRLERAIELCKVFDTPNIRVFSYYPPGDAADWNGVPTVGTGTVHTPGRRRQSLPQVPASACSTRTNIAFMATRRIAYVDLFQVVPNDAFRAVYDPANYVFCGYDPWEGWQKTKDVTAHFHIKDWIAGEKHGCLAGEGQGRIPEVIADAVARGYDGFATLEPHLLGGGPTGGVTGPELFPKAVAAFTAILDRAGAKYQ